MSPRLLWEVRHERKRVRFWGRRASLGLWRVGSGGWERRAKGGRILGRGGRRRDGWGSGVGRW